MPTGMGGNLAPAPAKGRRIPTLDIVRGVLMTLIITTHMIANSESMGTLRVTIVRSLLSGTVGFCTVSGMLIGYFLKTKAGDLPRVLHRYTVRGMVLALVAHPLISIALYAPAGNGRSLLDFMSHSFFLTDALALLFLVLVPLTPRMTPGVRLGLGLALMFAARFIFIIPVHSRALLAVREVLAGLDMRDDTVLLSTYPLLSIAGMFLVGSWIGDRYALAQAAGELPRLGRRFFSSAGVLVLASCALVGLWVILKRHIAGANAPVLQQFIGLDYEFSAYPAYLASVLCMMALLMARSTVSRIERFFVRFGRTSLFTYIVQYYVVQTLPWLLRLRHRMRPWQIVAYLVVAVPVMNIAATALDRYKAGSPPRPHSSAKPG